LLGVRDAEQRSEGERLVDIPKDAGTESRNQWRGGEERRPNEKQRKTEEEN